MRKGFKWIIAFAGAIVIVLLLRGFAFTSCLIPSSGMENSLFQGERILVNKWSYGLRAPYMSLFSYHRWNPRRIDKDDIVVFNNPAAIKEPVIDRREIYISRCIGVPGDTLLIDSLFNVVDRNTQLGPDRKQLYTYPQTKEQQLDSLLSILSIGSNELMGQHEGKNVRSFSPSEFIRGTGPCCGIRWCCMKANKRKSGTIRSTLKVTLHSIAILPKIITGWLPITR